MKTEILPNHKFHPYMFLEGSTGLNELEEDLYYSVIASKQTAWEIEDLYKFPERLFCIELLKPKTIILGTTGMFEDKLEVLISIFFKIDISSIENVILTLSTEDVLRDEMKKLREKIPNVRFWKIGSEEIEPKSWSSEVTGIYPSKKFSIYEIFK